MWYYFIGMALLGIATGFLVANSMTPIVGVLLPLLFGLIGGGAGAYILKLDPNTELDQKRLFLLGLSITLFFGPFLVSLLYSISTRYESLTFPLADVTGFDAIESPQVYRMLSMRKRLQILGATPEEQKTVLERALREKSKAAKRLEEKSKSIVSETSVSQQMLDSLNELLPLIAHARKMFDQHELASSVKDNKKAELLDRLRAALFTAETALSYRLPELKSNDAAALDRVSQQIDDLRRRLSEVLDSSAETTAVGFLFSQHRPAVEALIRLKQVAEDFGDLKPSTQKWEKVSQGQILNFNSPPWRGDDEELVRLLITMQAKQQSFMGNLLVERPGDRNVWSGPRM